MQCICGLWLRHLSCRTADLIMTTCDVRRRWIAVKVDVVLIGLAKIRVRRPLSFHPNRTTLHSPSPVRGQHLNSNVRINDSGEESAAQAERSDPPSSCATSGPEWRAALDAAASRSRTDASACCHDANFWGCCDRAGSALASSRAALQALSCIACT